MNANNPDNEQELLRLISQGDEKAFRSLFDQHHSRLSQYTFNIVKSREVAEELVMDVFLKLWLAREKIIAIENMNGFLFRVAYNKSIDFFRASAKDRQFTELLWEKVQMPSPDNADAPLLTREYESKLRDAINLLTPQRKKIFSLSRDSGLSHAQIAQELGISKNTVANTIVDARQFILAHLVKHLGLVVLMAILIDFSKTK